MNRSSKPFYFLRRFAALSGPFADTPRVVDTDHRGVGFPRLRHLRLLFFLPFHHTVTSFVTPPFLKKGWCVTAGAQVKIIGICHEDCHGLIL